MNRRSSLAIGLMSLASLVVGCDYQNKRPPALPPGIVDGPLPTSPGQAAPDVSQFYLMPGSEGPSKAIDPEVEKRRKVILDNVVKLMRTASNNPGGPNFAIATDNLNELFEEGFKPSDYEFSEETKRYLTRKIAMVYGPKNAETVMKNFTSPKFTTKDARHIEDCMLYHAVATRVAGDGDDLTRVRRIFDWIVRNIELIPIRSLSGNGFEQAQARPADVLVRGMAAEEFGGYWSERGWLFMALCRQIGIDVGILTYTPQVASVITSAGAADRPPIVWVTAAAIGGKLYLFEQRLGVEIPGPDGTGVATLEEAITVPIVLERLGIPGSYPYPVTGLDIANSASRIGVLIDSSPGYMTPRMRLLEGLLRGENRTTLFRDPFAEADTFAKAVGRTRIGLINLWDLPVYVERALFEDPKFVAATQMSLQFFDSKYPLLQARTAHLRGDLDDAITKYVALRLIKDGVQKDPKKTPIPPEIQRGLDIYSTYFLAQCHMDKGNYKQGEDLFRQLLGMTPDPGAGRYYFYMLRWSALANLGRIAERKGDRAGAILFYTRGMQPYDRHGNLLRATNLIWADPFVEVAPPLPEAPLPPISSEAVPEPK